MCALRWETRTACSLLSTLSKMSMKAVVVRAFGDASVLKVEAVAIPAIAAAQVLVKVLATGVNPVEVRH